MKNCANWPRRKWPRNPPDKRSNLPLWCTRPGCDWPAPGIRIGTVEVISLARRPRRCGAFLWKWLVRKARLRHGGGVEHVPLDGLDVPENAPEERLVQVSEALDQLA